MSTNLISMFNELKNEPFYNKSYGEQLDGDDLAARDIFLECQARMEVKCHFCNGRGHTYRKCITKKEMDIAIRAKKHKSRWGTWKGRFFSKHMKEKGDKAEDDVKKRHKEEVIEH